MIDKHAAQPTVRTGNNRTASGRSPCSLVSIATCHHTPAQKERVVQQSTDILPGTSLRTFERAGRQEQKANIV